MLRISPRHSVHRWLRHNAILLLIVLFFSTHLVLAQQQSGVLYTGDPDHLTINDPQGNNNNSPVDFTPEEIRQMEQLFQRYQEEIINGWESKAIYTQAKLIKNKKDLQQNLEIFSGSDQKIQEYTNILQPLEQKIQTLKDQLTFLDQQVALTQYKVQNVTEQIIAKQEEIKRTMEDVEWAKVEVQNQEKIVLDYAKLIYQYEQQYYDADTKTINDLQLLLEDRPISKTISAGDYLRIVQKTGSRILDELKKVYEELANKEVELESKQDRLQLLRNELAKQQQTLQQEQTAKQELLSTTEGDEAKYQALLLETQQQKEQSAQDIELLKGNVAQIEKELEALRKNASNVDSATVQKKAESAAELMQSPTEEAATTTKKFPWPVQPKQGISAYFHDDNYVSVFGVDHGALDIPTPQGTEIHAPADAFVYKAKDNGLGYSYIILAHRGGFLTLYGHVSSILVKEGELVRQGDVIGLSGGAPGSKGAGWRTTGAHLHMEIWKDGKKVDPLIYMDLSQLPDGKYKKDKIPAKLEEVDLE